MSEDQHTQIMERLAGLQRGQFMLFLSLGLWTALIVAMMK